MNVLLKYYLLYFRTNPLGMKGHIAQRYGELVKELWSGTTKTTAPLKFRVRFLFIVICVLGFNIWLFLTWTRKITSHFRDLVFFLLIFFFLLRIYLKVINDRFKNHFYNQAGNLTLML